MWGRKAQHLMNRLVLSENLCNLVNELLFKKQVCQLELRLGFITKLRVESDSFCFISFLRSCSFHGTRSEMRPERSSDTLKS